MHPIFKDQAAESTNCNTQQEHSTYIATETSNVLFINLGQDIFPSPKPPKAPLKPTQWASVFLPKVQGPLLEVHHSPASSAKDKKEWNPTPSPNIRLPVIVERDKFTFIISELWPHN
jgi:hypothetical protein